MSIFRDADGREWRINLDAFTLDDVKKETGIDLADQSASGWFAVATDAGAVGRVLAVVCGDEIRAAKLTGRQFARGVRGEAVEAGRAALLSEGADFFPRSEWSAIVSNSTRRTEIQQQTTDMQTASGILQALATMPEGLQAGVMQAIRETMTSNSDSSNSPDASSAIGQESEQQPIATGWPVSAESIPAA